MNCPGCNKEVSNQEDKCPYCEYPLSEKERKKYLFGEKAIKAVLSVYRSGIISGIIFIIMGIALSIISIIFFKEQSLDKTIPTLVTDIINIILGLFMIIYIYHLRKNYISNIKS